jgi:hypothetical protein
MKIRKYDPDERAKQKQAPREADDEAVRSGAISREEMQRINGNGDMFRKAKIFHMPGIKQKPERKG